MKQVTLSTIQQLCADGQKFTVLTAYDATMANLVSSNGCEIILVGDSLGMVVQGKESTLPVTIDDMEYHTQAVRRGNQGALLMIDMPFASYATTKDCVLNAARLMQAGGHIVKIEGGQWLTRQIGALSNNGIPVCVHLGLTPQSVNKFGGYKVQGRDDLAAINMIADAQAAAAAGADMLLLECVPRSLAAEITAAVSIPVIGIGAGNVTDGQVLVCYDMLGLTAGHVPKFVKNYLTNGNTPADAIREYVAEVKSGEFPTLEQSF